MKIDILTLFPSMFDGIINETILKRARKSGKVKISVHNLRDWSKDKHNKVDDRPYGGGPGMVLQSQPVFNAIAEILGCSVASLTKNKNKIKKKARIVFLTPQGKKLEQKVVKRLEKHKHLILICGHYEGIDERVRKHLVTDEVSIGDYVLTCGEIPAMVLIDAVVRLIPGVLGHKDSNKLESFSENLLEYPHYTRPADFCGLKVPKELLSGNHKKIEKWRRAQSIKRTKQRRPELLMSKNY